MSKNTIVSLGAVFGDGGTVLVHFAQGYITTTDNQSLVRLTVSGMNSGTTYVYLDHAARDALVSALMAADFSVVEGQAVRV